MQKSLVMLSNLFIPAGIEYRNVVSVTRSLSKYDNHQHSYFLFYFASGSGIEGGDPGRGS